jgi:phage terminase small subunit
MKLVPNDESSNQCQAMTKSGSQCNREAVDGGYCSQHHKLTQGRSKAGGKVTLDEIPRPPVNLNDKGAKAWRVYCQYLIDEGRLYEVYLLGVADLCHLEAQLEKVEQKVKEYGAVNVYDNSIQRNGYASHYDKIQQHIRNLRADYGFTVASEKVGVAEKEVSTYDSRKSKEW